MVYDVLVKKENNQRFTAQVLLLPDIIVSGESEDDVLEQIKSAIIDLRSRSRIVHVDVPPLADEKANPWLRYAGFWADDPDWDLFQDEVEAFRRDIDSTMRPIPN